MEGTRARAAKIATALNARLDSRGQGLRFKALKRWSIENWLRGYQYGPVQRCRYCDHTTPHHYPTCRIEAHRREVTA